MFKHFRERLAFLIAPWTGPSTVVERVVQYVYPAPTTTAAAVAKALDLHMKGTQ